MPLQSLWFEEVVLFRLFLTGLCAALVFDSGIATAQEKGFIGFQFHGHPSPYDTTGIVTPLEAQKIFDTPDPAGNGSPELNLGIAADFGNQPDVAVKWYERSSDAGNFGGTLLYGRAQLYGKGTAFDPDNAVQNLMKAYESGQTDAARDLAKAYAYGWAGSNPAEAMEFWRQSLAKPDLVDLADYARYLNAGGEPVAGLPDQVAVAKGLIFADPIWGSVVASDLLAADKKDLSIVIPALQQSHEAGNLEATARLGEAYLQGTGVVKDEAKGLNLLYQAKAAGNPLAYGALGDYFLERPDPVAGRDEKLALSYLALASRAGDANATLSLSRHALKLGNYVEAYDQALVGGQQGNWTNSVAAGNIREEACAKAETRCETIRIPFATTRASTKDATGKVMFSDLPNGNFETSYGVATVEVPVSEATPGQQSLLDYIGRAFLDLLGLSPRPSDPLAMADGWVDGLMDWKALVSATKKAMDLEQQEDGTHQVILFVHGVDTSFSDAILALARLKPRANLPGIPFLYSWPAGKGLLRPTAGAPFGSGYGEDVATASSSCPSFQRFVSNFLNAVGPSNVVIIAHSHGAELVQYGLTICGGQPPDTKRAPSGLKAVIYAAPDVDQVDFKNVEPQIIEANKNVTLYASNEDLALFISGEILSADKPKAGAGGPLRTVIQGLDTIDASSVAVYSDDIAGHGYLFGLKPVLDDLRELVSHGTPAATRCLQSEKDDTTPLSYWQFRQTCAF